MQNVLIAHRNLLNPRGEAITPQQAEFLLLRLLVSHYRQSLDGQVIFQEVYGYLPQSNLEQAIALNFAGIRTKYFQDPEPNSSDLRGFALTGIYLLTGILPGRLRISRETGEIFWYQYAGEINPDLVELIDRALYCSRNDRFSVGQNILNTLQNHLQQPTPQFPKSEASLVPPVEGKSSQFPQGQDQSQSQGQGQGQGQSFPRSPTQFSTKSKVSTKPKAKSLTKPLAKPFIYGNLVVGASIAFGLVMIKQLLTPKSVPQPENNPATPTKPEANNPNPDSSPNSPPNNFRSPSLSVSSIPNNDPTFAKAIATARQAIVLEEVAPNKRQWAEVAPLWQQAIQQMQAVPPTSSSYAAAQQKAQEYQTYLSFAQKQFDPFVAGIKRATQAVQAGQTARTRNQWQQADQYWQQAIQQMQAVPKNHSNYSTAQNKVKEYQRYQASVQTKLVSLPAVNPGKMTFLKTIRGDISPKSIVHSGAGLFFAQNMMYRHTITVYDRNFHLVKTISDRVQLSDYGHQGYSGSYQGSPVEAAFSHRGKYAWVSNYEMIGKGFNNPGDDVCNPGAKYDPSFVYRIDTGSLQIDRAIKVGAVPKYTAVSPDDRYVLVTNWCSWDVSIIDTQKNQEVQRVNLGAYPRGTAIDRKSQKAYIAVMGSTDVAVLNLQNLSLNWLKGMGNAPRHVNISPDDRFLYVSFNGEGRVGKIDLNTGKVIKKVATGQSPRSMAISGNGEFLYVVNYDSQSFSKVRTTDMEVVETINVEANPIGITYDSETNQVWVACYSGSIWVFQD